MPMKKYIKNRISQQVVKGSTVLAVRILGEIMSLRSFYFIGSPRDDDLGDSRLLRH